MKRTHSRASVLIAVGVLAGSAWIAGDAFAQCCGGASAQQPGSHDPGRQQAMQARGAGGQGLAPHRMTGRMRARRGGLTASLLGHPEVAVEVEQIDRGVSVVVTSQDPELAERIREELPDRLEWLRARRGIPPGQRGGPGRQGRGPRARIAGARIPPLMQAEVETEPLDQGVKILLTSDEPEQVKVIQQVLPGRIEAVRHFARGARATRESAMAHPRIRRMQAWEELFRSEEVDLEVEETDEGVVIGLTSEDPEQVERIHDLVREAVERLEERGERRAAVRQAREDRERARAMRRGPEARLLPLRDEELREIIRQEVRRYLEEEEEEEELD